MYIFSDMDSSAECDINLFWAMLKKFRQSKTPGCNHLEHNGVILKDDDNIREAWADYFIFSS